MGAYSLKLKARYKEEIESWNWEALKWEAKENEDCDGFYETAYVGTAFGLVPSGKYYTFWTTNQTGRDVVRDTAWWEALREVLEDKGYWDEGDSGDIFICRGITNWVIRIQCYDGNGWTSNREDAKLFPPDWDSPADCAEYAEIPCDSMGMPWLFESEEAVLQWAEEKIKSRLLNTIAQALI